MVTFTTIIRLVSHSEYLAPFCLVLGIDPSGLFKVMSVVEVSLPLAMRDLDAAGLYCRAVHLYADVQHIHVCLETRA